jgi:hypothetical protein
MENAQVRVIDGSQPKHIKPKIGGPKLLKK